MRLAAALVLAASTSVLLTAPLVEVARLKPFWRDEGFEIAETCRYSYVHLLVKGAPGQCSPSPLYYLLERASVRSIARFDERIAVGYRRVSLGAAALLLFSLVAVLFLRLGPTWGLAAAASLASQPLFVQYAAENRPYLTWLLLFTLTVLAGAAAASCRLRELGRGRGLVLAGGALALSLVALPGAEQAAAACALCGLVWWRGAEEAAEARASLRWALLLAALCLAVGLYFAARSPCAGYDAGHLALRRPEQADLVRPVLALLWGDDLAGHAGNVLLVASLLVVWRRARPSDTLDQAQRARFARGLAAALLAQGGLTVVLAAQVIVAGYYFIPRVFLHLAVCRALGIALGGWLVVDWIVHRSARSLRAAWPTLAATLAVLAVASAFVSERQDVEERREARPAPGPCPELGGSFVVDMPVGTRDWARGPNLIVELGEEKRRCGAPPSAALRHVLVDAGSEPRFRVSADRPADAVPLEQCGRPVVVGP